MTRIVIEITEKKDAPEASADTLLWVLQWRLSDFEYTIKEVEDDTAIHTA